MTVTDAPGLSGALIGGKFLEILPSLATVML